MVKKVHEIRWHEMAVEHMWPTYVRVLLLVVADLSLLLICRVGERLERVRGGEHVVKWHGLLLLSAKLVGVVYAELSDLVHDALLQGGKV